MRPVILLMVTVGGVAGCSGPQVGDRVIPGRWVDGNGRWVDGNAHDLEGGLLSAEARSADGVVRTVWVNDLGPNPAGRTSEEHALAADYGFLEPEVIDAFIEGYPGGSAPDATDPCLALDAGASAPAGWRIAATEVIEGSDVRSGHLQLLVDGSWLDAELGQAYYLPASATAALGPGDTGAQWPVMFRVEAIDWPTFRDPAPDPEVWAPESTDPIRTFRKQLFFVDMCSPQAPSPQWIPAGLVTVGDAFRFDLLGAQDSIRSLEPRLRFNTYLGIDPTSTASKAEAYYTAGLVARGDPQRHFRLDCEDPALDGLAISPAAANAAVAIVFANAITLVLVPNGQGALVGMTVVGTPVRISLLAPDGCTIVMPPLLAGTGGVELSSWAPDVQEQSSVPDSITGLPLGDPSASADIHRCSNSTACGDNLEREAFWSAGDPYLEPLRAQRHTRCQAVRLATANDFLSGYIEAFPQLLAIEDRVTVTATHAAGAEHCGDEVCDPEFGEDHDTCAVDCTFEVAASEME